MQTFVSERWWSLTWVSCSTVWPSQERWHWSEPDAPPLRHCPCSNNPPCSPGLQNKKKTTTQRCNHCLNWKSAKLSHRKRKDINMTFHSLLFCLKSIITLIVYNIYTHVYIREYVNVRNKTLNRKIISEVIGIMNHDDKWRYSYRMRLILLIYRRLRFWRFTNEWHVILFIHL